MKKKFRLSFVALPYTVYALIFILAPMVLIVVYSLCYQQGGGWELTLKYFEKFFDLSNPMYLRSLWDSVWIAALSTIVCLILGYPMAYILSKMRPSVRGMVSFLFVLPMWMNFLLRTFAWMTLLENTGVINTLLGHIGVGPVQFMYTKGAIVFGNVYNFLPFMILPIYNTIVKLDGMYLEAAGDLGANFSATFRRVIFPLSLPGVVSGVTMTFVPAVTTFIVSRLLGGKNALIGDLIEREFATGNWGFGSAMSVIIMVMILLMMGVMGRYEKEQSASGGLLM